MRKLILIACMLVSCETNADATTNPQDVIFEQALKSSIPIFNEWFGVHIDNLDQLSKIAHQQTTNYFTNLRACSPGTYKYPIFDPMMASTADLTKPFQFYSLGTSTILGNQNNICEVDTSIKTATQLINLKCKFTPPTLAMFTDELAKQYVSKGELAYVTDNNLLSSHNLSNFINKECQKIISAEDKKASNQLRDYIAKFKTCTPGTYTNPRDATSVVTVISGYANNHCVLEGTFTVGLEVTKVKCKYTQPSLNYFADAAEKRLNKQTEDTSPEVMTILKNAFKECDDVWVPI
jgi:hypothetical protein